MVYAFYINEEKCLKSAVSEVATASLEEILRISKSNISIRSDEHYRCALVAPTLSELKVKLNAADFYCYKNKKTRRRNVFMFSGLGGQFLNMGNHLYNNVPSIKQDIDFCFEHVRSKYGIDLKEVVFEAVQENIDSSDTLDMQKMFVKEASTEIDNTLHAHTLIAIFQYTIANYLIKRGVQAHLCIGHSLGEYMAAVFAGVLDLKDALDMIVCRAKLIEEKTEDGELVAVLSAAPEIASLLNSEVSVALDNSAYSCVISGTPEGCKRFTQLLDEKEIFYRLVKASKPFHSKMMEPIFGELKNIYSNIQFRKPTLPIVSNITGAYAKDNELLDAAYWAQHTCSVVKFREGIATILHNRDRLNFIEIGPENGLCGFVSQSESLQNKKDISIFSTMPSKYLDINSDLYLNDTLLKYWCQGNDLVY